LSFAACAYHLTAPPPTDLNTLSLHDALPICWCAPGKANTCGKRFEWQLGDLPAGYDHKYTYSHLGYNLKLTDMQAAVGVAQLGRSEEHTSELQSRFDLVCRLLLEKQNFIEMV